MVSKREGLLKQIAALDALICPVCSAKLEIQDTTLMCRNSHGFDINKKGFVNLAQRQIATYYDETLFSARGRVFADGFYEPVAAIIAKLIVGAQRVLDAGCGEGYYLHTLNVPIGVGVDLSREAIRMAALKHAGPIWCVADLKSPPFTPGTFDAVLDILSPANYEAFFRVLKPGGKLIKVIPGTDYLKEIRLKMDMPPYDEKRVLEHLGRSARVEKISSVCQTRPVSPEIWRDFVYMTPLTQNLTHIQKDALAANPASQITIDLRVVCAQMI